MITENLSTLQIHKLTQAQYDRELAANSLNPNVLYLTPDTTIPVDTTLALEGGAVDAKATGDAIAAIDTLIDIKIETARNSIYPVGSIYFSVNEIEPSQILEFGTWE